MARSFDQLLVIDIESTCWKDHPPSGQQNEIIEIGITPVNLINLLPEKSSCIMVRPEISTVSEFCTSLTSLTQQDVENGILFSAACDQLRTFGSSSRTWGSWGDYDRKQFERQCRQEHFHARYPFGPTHLNIKNLFALHMGLKKEVGMDKALEILGIELEGTHHRGMDDSRNIAKIVCHLLKSSRISLNVKGFQVV